MNKDVTLRDRMHTLPQIMEGFRSAILLHPALFGQ